MIDACAHPVVAQPGHINAYLPPQYREARLAEPGFGPYQQAGDAHVSGALPANGDLPGSDRELFTAHVLDAAAADYAVLLPLTRGLLGDAAFAAAVDSATNLWLAETWLGEHNADGRYKGSIRVCPRSPAEAVREIERWADHPHFIQVAVPLEALTPYGEPEYFEVWRAAADRGLPVAIHSDHNIGVMKPPTSAGFPSTYLEHYAQQSVYAVGHLGSMLGYGVFDRLDSLKVVFADGGFDFFQTLLWRLDKDWRATVTEVPLLQRAPSEYVPEHVRIVIHAGDGREDAEAYRRFIELNGLGDVLLYGSNYPSWDHLRSDVLAEMLPDESRERILDGNARALYGLAVPA